MSAPSRTSSRPVALWLAIVASLCLAATAAAGPPWISVEIPANPHDPATRGALLMVRAYHHGAGVAYAVTGVAEGRVDGRRVSVPLVVSRTGAAGVYAVARPELESGQWVLVLRLQDGRASATALVPLSATGNVAGAMVPARRSSDGWMIPRDVSDADIEAALRGELAMDADETVGRVLLLGVAGLAALVPWFRRRRR